MSADSYFAIGSAHQVCQDHAISDGDFVILSDGCSGAKDSDWGARFITKSAYNILKQTKPGYLHKFIDNVMKGAQSYVEKLELHPDCLAATFLFAYQQHKLITACVAGDGYIIAKYREKNKLKIFSYMYDTGAPWYPHYTMNEDLTKGYLEHYGHGKLISGITEIEDGKVISHNDLICAMKAEATRVPIGIMLPTDVFELVGIASDGLKSFVQQAKGSTSIVNKNIIPETFIKNLFDFKTKNGKFVQRKCLRFLRDLRADNIKHTDDFSLGVIAID